MRRRLAERKYGDPTDGIDYYWAANNAFLTASNLMEVVNSVPGEKVVMAHSLGAVAASSAFVDHGMVADKYFALNAAVASEAFDSTLFNTSTNNPLVHVYWHDYLPRTWSACWNELFPAGDDRGKLTWRDRFAAVGEYTSMYNYWSSGDEVLEIGNPGLDVFSYDGSVIQYVWHKQELFKGRNIIYGSGWAGWGFESNAVASVANAASDAVLQTAPIFEAGPEGMYSSSIPQPLQNKLVAYAIPALSEPVGRTELPRLGQKRNFDMNAMKPRNGLWCRDHEYYRFRWLHNDIQDIGYFFSNRVFDDFVEKGALK